MGLCCSPVAALVSEINSLATLPAHAPLHSTVNDIHDPTALIIVNDIHSYRGPQLFYSERAYKRSRSTRIQQNSGKGRGSSKRLGTLRCKQHSSKPPSTLNQPTSLHPTQTSIASIFTTKQAMAGPDILCQSQLTLLLTLATLDSY